MKYQEVKALSSHKRLCIISETNTKFAQKYCCGQKPTFFRYLYIFFNFFYRIVIRRKSGFLSASKITNGKTLVFQGV